MRKLILLACVGMLVCGETVAADDNVQIIDVLPGQASDVYFFVNLKGKVYLKIAAEGNNKPCAEFWWIKWGFGSITSLGEKCGEFVVDLPEGTLPEPILSGKLRTSGAPYRLKIAASAQESVVHTVTLHFD